MKGKILRAENVREEIDALRLSGVKIALTSGTFDLFHIGHARYLRAAKEAGGPAAILVVGIDSDAKVRTRKGPRRPIVPEDERSEMVLHTYGDIAVIKEDGGEKWSLIKAVRPDVLVTSERSEYSPEDLDALKAYCGEVVVLPSQAETSTSAKIRLLVISVAGEIGSSYRELAEDLKGKIDQFGDLIERLVKGW